MCALELAAQPCVLLLQLLQLACLGERWISLRAALTWGQRGLLGAVALFSPGRQHRGIDAFTTQQCTELSRFGTPVSLAEDALLLGRGKLAPFGYRGYLGIRRRAR